MFLSLFERDELGKILAAIAAAETGPTEAELVAAPILDEWQPLFRKKVVILTGVVTGHPLLGNDGITTSPLIRINIVEKWARTESRWYRLGTSLAEHAAEFGAQLQTYDADGYEALIDISSLEERLASYIKDVREIERRARS